MLLEFVQRFLARQRAAEVVQDLGAAFDLVVRLQPLHPEGVPLELTAAQQSAAGEICTSTLVNRRYGMMAWSAAWVRWLHSAGSSGLTSVFRPTSSQYA